MSSLLQPWTIFVFKLIFATYLLLTVVVLINLLIAMMSDTYQRIQQQVISLADRLHYGAHKLCMNQSGMDWYLTQGLLAMALYSVFLDFL